MNPRSNDGDARKSKLPPGLGPHPPYPSADRAFRWIIPQKKFYPQKTANAHDGKRSKMSDYAAVKPHGLRCKAKPNWSAIEQAAIAGVPYSMLAQRHGVSLDAVKKRASRAKWPVPARIMRRARELSPRVTDEAVTESAESLLREGNLASGYAMRVLLGKLSKAASNPASISDLTNVQGVLTSLKGARLAAGMDKPVSAVTINIPGWAACVSMQRSDSGFMDFEPMEGDEGN